jgi:hypothetical protein
MIRPRVSSETDRSAIDPSALKKTESSTRRIFAPASIVTLARTARPPKQPFPNSVTNAGIRMFLNDMQPINCESSANVTSKRLMRPAKHSSLRRVAGPGIQIDGQPGQSFRRRSIRVKSRAWSICFAIGE